MNYKLYIISNFGGDRLYFTHQDGPDKSKVAVITEEDVILVRLKCSVSFFTEETDEPISYKPDDACT